jgi:hypothetical protein
MILLEDAEDIAVMLAATNRAVPSACWAEEVIAAVQDAAMQNMAGI